MKTVLVASALAAVGFLAGSASGRPLNHKRKLITKVVFVTETVADVIVYVDQTGAPFSTSTSDRVDSMTFLALPSTTEVAVPTLETPLTSSSAVPESIPEPTSTEEPSSVVVAPSPKSIAIGVQDATITTMSPSSTSESPSIDPVSTQESEPALQSSLPAEDVPVDTDAAGSLPLGIAWDAFTSSSGCKSADEVASEFSAMKDYKVIRIYGMGCDQIPLAVQNARKNGQKLMGGAYIDPSSDQGEDLSNVIEAYKDAIDQFADGDWDIIQLFAVENERVNDKAMTAPQVVNAIGDARNQLRHLGYNGPVGAVETAPATIDNPSICGASDVVMVNIHAFFDRNTKAADAGPFVKTQVERVKSACSNKRVIVTESGWPHQGNANGNAVPSPDNQRAALESIRNNFISDMFLFSAFDSRWKANTASTFNAEQYWGVIN